MELIQNLTDAIDAIKSAPVMIPGDKYNCVMRIECTSGFDVFWAELANELDGDRGLALMKGLILLRIALDAKREGKRLAVIDDRAGIEEDVVEV